MYFFSQNQCRCCFQVLLSVSHDVRGSERFIGDKRNDVIRVSPGARTILLEHLILVAHTGTLFQPVREEADGARSSPRITLHE
jgi:hypothetical protein